MENHLSQLETKAISLAQVLNPQLWYSSPALGDLPSLSLLCLHIQNDLGAAFGFINPSPVHSVVLEYWSIRT